MQYTLTKTTDGNTVLSVITDNGLQTMTSEHPNYTAVLQELLGNDPSSDTIDALIAQRPSQIVANQLQQLTDHVSYDGTDILYDDEPLHSSIAEHIRQSLIDGNTQWEPLAKFLERLAHNPSMVARNELYDWLNTEGLTVAQDGRFIGYKGLRQDCHSSHSGWAYVNGDYVSGHIPNHIGSIISMDRSAVNDDRFTGCSFGLHVGTTDYAIGFSRGMIATVAVDPADVVSIPVDSNYQKIRCCAYEVIALHTLDAMEHLGYNQVVDTDKLKDFTSAQENDEDEDVDFNEDDDN